MNGWHKKRCYTCIHYDYMVCTSYDGEDEQYYHQCKLDPNGWGYEKPFRTCWCKNFKMKEEYKKPYHDRQKFHKRFVDKKRHFRWLWKLENRIWIYDRKREKRQRRKKNAP